MLKQQLSQKLQQKLSPQQIQLMKLLQIPTAILDQRIKEELEANPALDEGDTNEEDYLEMGRSEDEQNQEEDNSNESDVDDLERDELPPEEEVSLDDYFNDYMEDDDASYKLKGDTYSQDEENKTLPIPVENTFHEYLETQLGMLNYKEEREKIIARQIVGSIDDDGYLRRETDAILDDLVFSQNVSATAEEVNYWLEKIQRFDPPGIGARNLQECLILQIENKRTREEITLDDKRVLLISHKIIAQYFDEFTKKHYQRLQRQLGITEEELKEAIDEILKLNPKPASGYVSSTRNPHYIVPDFIIINNDGELELSLNTRNAPDLHINNHYRDMLRAYKTTVKGRRATRQEKEAIMFIKQKIDSAKWFIDAIRQRQQTMFNTMYAIMNYQYDYFESGDQKRLRPMILKDIADITGLDISTVSRVANSKFVQTEFGTKRLKDFFSESLQTQDGEEVSTLEVKKILTDIISAENKRKPFSDEKLKNLLQKKGYNIARRTVAKYREQLNIPVARLRKEL
ncbi:MAG: RNA polymerase factor sigma-54 [Lewinellaceae bacterium]|nr:RNA polymerase factor sigma-54 [Saprospiraceae bacterium]MCB9337926.1 RNA polymerase factor sigma-54 [Lewinellaceae bacterium]